MIKTHDWLSFEGGGGCNGQILSEFLLSTQQLMEYIFVF